MKKNFKLVLALVLSIMMILGSVAALADDVPTGSITIKPSDTVPVKTKSLSAYKILDATYSGTGEDQAVAYTVPAAMKDFYESYFGREANSTVTPPVEAATASELAAAANKTFDVYVVEHIAAMGQDSDAIVDFEYAALAYAEEHLTAISGVVDGENIKFAEREPGYYVIKDNDTNQPVSAVMLDTVTDANVDIVLKASDKTEKKIQTAGDLTNDKANELGLGKTVEYVITQEIPNYRGYDYFYYMINDTLSDGLTFLPGTVVVKVDGETMIPGQDYHLYYEGDSHNTTSAFLAGKTFIVAFEDIVKSTKINIGDAVEVTYNANVNASAVVGVNPNTNEVNVQYSTNPDKDGRGDYDTDHPGIPKNDEDHPTGIGPSKWTDTFTTELAVYKQDGQTKQRLNGVSFNLTGTCQDVVVYAQDIFEEDATEGTYWKLNNGTYTEQEPREQVTLNVVDGAQGGWVEVSQEAAEAYAAAHSGEEGYVAPRTIGDKYYRPYIAETDTNETVYEILEPNSDEYASLTTKYKLVHAKGNEQQAYTDTRNGTTAGQGTLTFSQLGAGSYTLTETTGLPGYNSIAPITFTIACELPDADTVKNGTETATWSVTAQNNGTVMYDAQTGTFSITIDNNKGATLPSTGGIGTTIFYIGGSVLVLAAAILLITKRRMSSND